MKRKSLLIKLLLVLVLLPCLSYGAVFTNSSALSGGWKWSPWFGYYHDGNSTWTGSQGWIYHLEHEWLYVIENPGNGMFLWSQRSGWWWTTATIYSNLYSFDNEWWLWYSTGSKNRAGSITTRWRDGRR